MFSTLAAEPGGQAHGVLPRLHFAVCLWARALLCRAVEACAAITIISRSHHQVSWEIKRWLTHESIWRSTLKAPHLPFGLSLHSWTTHCLSFSLTPNPVGSVTTTFLFIVSVQHQSSSLNCTVHKHRAFICFVSGTWQNSRRSVCILWLNSVKLIAWYLRMLVFKMCIGGWFGSSSKFLADPTALCEWVLKLTDSCT